MSAVTHRKGPVLHVVNNNPAARNALSGAYVEGLIAAIARAGEDREIAAVILSGADGFFCAGGDLNILIERREMPLAERIAAIERLHGAIRAIRACPKPVIAAIEGGAAGAGASIALACDLAVAARDAYFALTYLRVGLTPDGGASAFLSRIAPRQLVNEILMFGDKIGVERLQALGAINRICDPGRAVGEAQMLGERIDCVAPEALAAVKALVLAAGENTLDQQLDLEARVMGEAQGGDEAAEGISAFLGKRKPDFSRFRD
ncbi:MAG: oxepin-CoA hydrolase, alternative type [Paracoccaceae bacterium]